MPSLAERLRRLFRGPCAGIAYWERRAREHGRRSVLNLSHAESEVEPVTQRQIDLLFPLLRKQLDGGERVALDFGCGTGRFSAVLAAAIGGSVVAVDPVQRLLDLAPASPGVSYRRMDAFIPMDTSSADVVWVCLVLGTIVDDHILEKSRDEILRVLRPGGLLFLVENTAEKRDIRHFRFRSEEQYRRMFPIVPLEIVGRYDDVGERISVMSGRKSH